MYKAVVKTLFRTVHTGRRYRGCGRMENIFREKIKNTAERLRRDDLIAIYRDILGKYQRCKII